MNRQELLYGMLGITAVLELAVSPLEYHSLAFAEFAGYIALVGFLGIVAVFVIALRNFSRETSSTNRANLFFIATGPFAVGLLLTLFHREPNVHGFSFPAFFLYFAISELCALILLIRLF